MSKRDTYSYTLHCYEGKQGRYVLSASTEEPVRPDSRLIMTRVQYSLTIE